RHTRSDRDWSSDVCSSDLEGKLRSRKSTLRAWNNVSSSRGPPMNQYWYAVLSLTELTSQFLVRFEPTNEKGSIGRKGSWSDGLRSEERRVGKGCRSRMTWE